VGRLVYNDDARSSYDLDDDLLVQLRAAVIAKLRRNESFAISLPYDAAGGYRSLWVSPSVPLVFHFFSIRPLRVNREVVETLLTTSDGPEGIDLRRYPRLPPLPPRPEVPLIAGEILLG
jgi:hypothetical protein